MQFSAFEPNNTKPCEFMPLNLFLIQLVWLLSNLRNGWENVQSASWLTSCKMKNEEGKLSVDLLNENYVFDVLKDILKECCHSGRILIIVQKKDLSVIYMKEILDFLELPTPSIVIRS